MFFSNICPGVGLQVHVVDLFCFLRNHHTVLHNGYTNLHSHQQCRKFPFSPQLFQHLFFVGFFDDSHSGRCEVILNLKLVEVKKS